MKKLILIIAAVAGLVFASQAQIGPVYGAQTLGSFTVAASTASNVNYVIDCRKQKDVCVQLTSTNTVDGTADGATTIKFYFQRSIDGSTYDTTGATVQHLVPNGKTAITSTTNLATGGCGFIKILYVTNSAVASTNVGWATLSYGVKIGAP